MKTLHIRTKRLKFILLLVAVCLVFSSFVKAETDSVTSDTTLQVEAETAAKPSLIEEEPTVQASGAGEMMAMSSVAPPAVSPSAMGGAFSSLMSESFKTDLATGAATLNIPIVVPPGRKNVQPNIALSYSSNNSNGICGVGWSLPVSAIQRSTKEGVPRYSSMEDFVVGGEELVKIKEDLAKGEYEYRAKIESSFTKYVYIKDEIKGVNQWIAYDKSGTQYHFGSPPEPGFTPQSRMDNPSNPSYIFAWYLDKVVDVYGNAMIYTYWKDENYVYLENIYYTSNSPSSLKADKRVEFVYNKSAERSDKIYNRRAGWPTVIKRKLENIKVYMDFNKDQVWEEGEVVWTYNLDYWPGTYSSTSRSLLKSIQVTDGKDTLPAKTFTYQKLD